MSFDSWLSQRIYKTQKAGLYRKLRTMETSPQPKMSVEGRDQLVFSSNNYLGLAGDKRLSDAAEKVLHEFGVGSSGSRLTTGNTSWHEKLEEKLAKFKKTEASLVFSTGYLANVGVLSSLPIEGDVLLSDALNHASIIDGCRLSRADTIVYQHKNMKDLEKKLQETASYKRRFIVTDGVFSMDGTIAPLDEIMSLAKRYQAFVIVDDAHATGVLGEKGRGTSEYFGVMPDVMIGTLSKAAGTEGGFVAGSRVLIDFLLNHARTFIFQTSLSPAICAASIESISIMEKDNMKQQRLLSNAKLVKDGLIEMGFQVMGDHTPIIPVLIGKAEKAVTLGSKLQEKGIFAPAIRPPTVPPDESRIRLTVTASHQRKDIDCLVESFQTIGKELKVII